MQTPALNDLPQLSSWLRYSKLSCEQAVGNSLTAIENDPQSPHIFAHVATDQARDTARQLDTAQAGQQGTKPLAGLPFAVQDVFTVDGQPGNAGSALDLTNLIPKQGPMIRKLRDLGAVPIGKTAATEFAFAFHNLNRPLPANPFYPDEAFTAGGNGSAVAIARGLCSFALGSDAVGATRAAAALCGVVGFRPSADFWARDGMFPLSRELDAIGMITKKIGDLAFMLEMLGAGTIPDMAGTKLHLGIAKKPFFEDMEPPVAQAISHVLDRLTKKGAALTPIVMPDYEALKSFTQVANGTGLVRYIGRDRTMRDFDMLDPVTQERIRPGMQADIAEIQHLFENRRVLSNRVNSNLGHIDALVMPTLPSTAVPMASLGEAHAATAWQSRISGNTSFVSLFNMAAITIPLPGPLPIGLQLVAPAGNEVKLTSVAKAIQQTLDM